VGLALAALLLGAAAPQPATQLEAAQSGLIAALRAGHVLDPARVLLRASYVCSVTSGGERLFVADVLEQVRGQPEPRNYERVVLLSAALAPLQQIDVTGATPWFCKSDSLYLSSDATAPDGSSGNVIEFLLGGAAVQMNELDPTRFPLPGG